MADQRFAAGLGKADWLVHSAPLALKQRVVLHHRLAHEEIVEALEGVIPAARSGVTFTARALSIHLGITTARAAHRS